MGNHEYCELCGQNTFHHDQPCDPEKRKEILLDKLISKQLKLAAVEEARRTVNSIHISTAEFREHGIFIPYTNWMPTKESVDTDRLKNLDIEKLEKLSLSYDLQIEHISYNKVF